MSANFAIGSALVAAALMLLALYRYASTRDFWYGFSGFAVIFLVSAGLGASGVLANFTRFPPPFILLLLGLLTVSMSIILSPWGSRVVTAVPLRVLIALQGFRIMPEILLDMAYRDGLAPVQMTWHGRNLDILSAVLGLILALTWNRLPQPRPFAWAYTLVGSGLLANIVSVAVLSAPVPFRVFMNEPANTFVAHFPYIWLPTIHVLIAIVLHGLAVRSLRRGQP